MSHNEAIEWIAGAKIRPWVVVALLQHLIDTHHPASLDATAVSEAKKDLQKRVATVYGTKETCPLVLEDDVLQSRHLQRKTAAEPPTNPITKHDTPEVSGANLLDGEAYLGDHRPNVVSKDYCIADTTDPEVQSIAALAHCSDEMTIDTGHDFWDQWQTPFLHWAFPYSIPAPLGGPDYPQKPRPRRQPQAAQFGPLAHLKHLAGRVESSIRNSWDLVPALRRLTFKWHSVWNGSLWRAWQATSKELQALPVEAWVQAAEGLYQKLRRGQY
eukprot:s3057_g20.t1